MVADTFHGTPAEHRNKEGEIDGQDEASCLFLLDGGVYDSFMETIEERDNKITPLGVTCYRDIRQVFGIRRKNRRGHIYMIGKTGTGKSTLLLNMATSDMRDGEGMAVIDPHGDLAEAVLERVPAERVDDVIYINPADFERPVPLNPLRKVRPELRHLVVSGIVSVFRKAWPDFWGPRLEHILRHALLTLLEHPGSTLLDVTQLLTDERFRASVLAHVSNRELHDFWGQEFDRYQARLRAEAVAPVLNRIGQLLTALPLRNLLGQAENSFSVRQAMDEGRIVVANLAKGRLGEDNASFLGALLLTQMQLAAASRADEPASTRRSFYLYVDEFHAFVTRAVVDALAESRKYGLSLTLAHQHLEQLGDELRGAVFGNVGTVISFRIGAEDAKYLASEFYPTFDEADFTRLPNYHMYLRMMIDGEPSRPFSASTDPAPGPAVSMRAETVRRSRERYGRPTAAVGR